MSSRKVILSLLVLTLFMLSFQLHNVVAVHGRIWPAIIVLSPDVTIYEANTDSSYFEITNLDSAAAEVYISPNNNLKDYVDVKTPYVYLEPGQTENISFDIAVEDALQHTGDIFVTFKDSSISYTYFVNLRIYPSASGYATNVQAPSAPTDLTPRKDYCTQDVTVSWTASTDPDTSTIIYEYEIDNNNDFSSKLDSGIVVGTEKTFHLDPGLYFWRIRAYDGKYYSPWVSSSFKINTPYECINRIGELENRINELESRFNLLESLVNAIKSAICTLGDFTFCGSEPAECAGTDTECGVGGMCQNCNLLDGCYSGYYRDYYCSSQSCVYTQTCTEACCDAIYGDPDAYCENDICNAPPQGPTCTDECTFGDTRCKDETTKQTCGNYDGDPCTEWGNDEICSNGCANGECISCLASGEECSDDSECCSNRCLTQRVCVQRDFRGFCKRYQYKKVCS